jgi:hypothetical protein
MMVVVAIFSKAWSIGGNGLTINIYMIVAFNALLIIGAVIAIFATDAINIILDILSFIIGAIGVALCVN